MLSENYHRHFSQSINEKINLWSIIDVSDMGYNIKSLDENSKIIIRLNLQYVQDLFEENGH